MTPWATRAISPAEAAFTRFRRAFFAAGRRPARTAALATPGLTLRTGHVEGVVVEDGRAYIVDPDTREVVDILD